MKRFHYYVTGFPGGEAMRGFSVWYKSKVVERGFWEKAVESGFDLVEIAVDYPWPWEGLFARAVEHAKAYGLKTSLHLPWRDISLASPYPQVRRGSVSTLSSILEHVSRWDFEYAVMHVSTLEWIPEHRISSFLSEVSRDISKLVELANKIGVSLLVENAQKPFVEKPRLLKTLAEELGIRICLDVGHIIINHARRGSSSNHIAKQVTRWASELGGIVGCVHVHGYNAGELKPHRSLEGLDSKILDSIRMALRELRKKRSPLPVVMEIFLDDTNTDEFFSSLSNEAIILGV